MDIADFCQPGGHDGGERPSNPNDLLTRRTQKVVLESTHGPGCDLIEYKGVERKNFILGAEDPGSPAFTMVVGNIDAAVAGWKTAGGTVVTTGGEAVKRPNGAGNVFVRDVNGFMWELIQRAAR